MDEIDDIVEIRIVWRETWGYPIDFDEIGEFDEINERSIPRGAGA